MPETKIQNKMPKKTEATGTQKIISGISTVILAIIIIF